MTFFDSCFLFLFSPSLADEFEVVKTEKSDLSRGIGLGKVKANPAAAAPGPEDLQKISGIEQHYPDKSLFKLLFMDDSGLFEIPNVPIFMRRTVF